MRPADLILPFTWNNPETLIEDRVWYVPEYAEKKPTFQFPGWSHPILFGNSHPICVEYCSGNGGWIAEKARFHPHLNWVAVERKYARVRKIWSKIKNLQLNNLLVLCGEAHHVTQCYFPSESIKEVYINFPDPWPKHRHAKNRLIQLAFVNQLYRILQTNASLTFVTDDPAYSNWFISTLQAYGRFQSLYPPPFYSTELQPDYGSSYFEELWRSKELLIRYHQFKRLS